MPENVQITFHQHIVDTIDFHREKDGLTYAAIIGVLEIVKHVLLTEVEEDDEEDDEEDGE